MQQKQHWWAETNIALAKHFLLSLIKHGVVHFAVCSGARSAPLLYALQLIIAEHKYLKNSINTKANNSNKKNSAAPKLQISISSHFDERSAAFFVLGFNKANCSENGSQAAAVITTSGSAAANLFPAVVEASSSEKELTVVTADRPPELIGVRANQAIWQKNIFHRYAVSNHLFSAPPLRLLTLLYKLSLTFSAITRSLNFFTFNLKNVVKKVNSPLQQKNISIKPKQPLQENPVQPILLKLLLFLQKKSISKKVDASFASFSNKAGTLHFNVPLRTPLLGGKENENYLLNNTSDLPSTDPYVYFLKNNNAKQFQKIPTYFESHGNGLTTPQYLSSKKKKFSKQEITAANSLQKALKRANFFPNKTNSNKRNDKIISFGEIHRFKNNKPQSLEKSKKDDLSNTLIIVGPSSKHEETALVHFLAHIATLQGKKPLLYASVLSSLRSKPFVEIALQSLSLPKNEKVNKKKISIDNLPWNFCEETARTYKEHVNVTSRINLENKSAVKQSISIKIANVIHFGGEILLQSLENKLSEFPPQHYVHFENRAMNYNPAGFVQTRKRCELTKLFACWKTLYGKELFKSHPLFPPTLSHYPFHFNNQSPQKRLTLQDSTSSQPLAFQTTKYSSFLPWKSSVIIEQSYLTSKSYSKKTNEQRLEKSNNFSKPCLWKTTSLSLKTNTEKNKLLKSSILSEVLLMQLLADFSSKWHEERGTRPKKISKKTNINKAGKPSTPTYQKATQQFLFLGNSMPLRTFQSIGGFHGFNRVYASRGASGIDGLVATAAGIANWHAVNTHLTAVVGDLSALHDTSSFFAIASIAKKTVLPLSLFIVNNHEGNIFRHLSFFKAMSTAKNTLLYKHSYGFSNLAKAANIPYVRISNTAQLKNYLQRQWAKRWMPTLATSRTRMAPKIVEVVINPTVNKNALEKFRRGL